MAGVADDPAKAVEARRVAGELEHPDEAEERRVAPPEQDVEQPGQRPQEIEDAAERHRPGEPRAPMRAMLARRGRGGEEPRDIFAGEEQADEVKDDIEPGVVGLPHLRLGIGEHDGDTGHDHRVMHAARRARRPPGRLGLHDPVKAVAGHAAIVDRFSKR
jgi:hypothetical protein